MNARLKALYSVLCTRINSPLMDEEAAAHPLQEERVSHGRAQPQKRLAAVFQKTATLCVPKDSLPLDSKHSLSSELPGTVTSDDTHHCEQPPPDATKHIGDGGVHRSSGSGSSNACSSGSSAIPQHLLKRWGGGENSMVELCQRKHNKSQASSEGLPRVPHISSSTNSSVEVRAPWSWFGCFWLKPEGSSADEFRKRSSDGDSLPPPTFTNISNPLSNSKGSVPLLSGTGRGGRQAWCGLPPSAPTITASQRRGRRVVPLSD